MRLQCPYSYGESLRQAPCLIQQYQRFGWYECRIQKSFNHFGGGFVFSEMVKRDPIVSLAAPECSF